MALKPCRECGKEVAETADKCPNCGAPLPAVSEDPTYQCVNCKKTFIYDPRKEAYPRCTYCGTQNPMKGSAGEKLARAGAGCGIVMLALLLLVLAVATAGAAIVSLLP
jgi:DNA-directed RNA polymerase subunit RPC12/RpoP